jgi:hypothetical protein
MDAPVYVNWGRLVADCPRPHCGDASAVEPGQQSMMCVNGHPATLRWAADTPAVLAVLDERTSDKRKNWFPAGHPFAVAAGLPHGQTLDELRAEAEAGEAADALQLADKRAAVLAQVQALDIPLEQVLDALKGS